jgi:hypothetical protein
MTLMNENGVPCMITSCRCILNWAHLEDELAWLLHLVLDSALNQVGMIIYHAPNNTETRIRIVDNVVSRDLELLIGGELIEPSWRSIVKLVSELKDKRNTVAHGQLVWHNRL